MIENKALSVYTHMHTLKYRFMKSVFWLLTYLDLQHSTATRTVGRLEEVHILVTSDMSCESE